MPNKILQKDEAALTWLASGGTAVLTLTSLGASAGRNGALHDLGTNARAYRFAWRCWVKFTSAPTVAQLVDIYLRTSDGTHPDNDDGVGDIALSHADKLRNLTYIGSIEVDEASATPEFVASGIVVVHARYVGPVIYNGTGVALSATAADHGFSLTPVPDEVQ